MGDEIPEEQNIDEVLRRYFEDKRAEVNTDKIYKKILGKMHIHDEAMFFIKIEAQKYSEKLYLFAKTAAEDDGERHIITKAHAERARLMVNQKKSGFDLSDALIGVGTLFAGAAVPHMFDLFDDPQPKAKVWLIIAGIIGTIISSVGFMQKAKK